MNVRSGREAQGSFRLGMALLLSLAGCLFAQSAWLQRTPTLHPIGMASDMVFVRRCGSTFVFLYTSNGYPGGGGFFSCFNAYSPQSGTWSSDLSSPPNATNLALAYSRDAMRMYAIGFFPNNGGNLFYTYVFDSPSGTSGAWSSEPLPFDLNPSSPGGCAGTKMTYRRNRDLAPLYAIPGWLYAIGKASAYEFHLYRYWIPNPGDAVVNGYNPGNTAVIADATPHFVWPPVPGALEYRIEVSSESSFSAVELDTVTVEPTCQVPATLPLTNGQKYWQTSSRDFKGNWTAGPVLSFSLFEGWEDQGMVPIIHGDFPMTGSTLIYTCMGPEWPKAESIWYNSGTASGWDPVMHAYSIHNGTWSTIGLPQGSLLDRHDNMMASAPSEYGLERSNQIYAVLDTDDVVGHHWKLNLVTNPAQWWKYTDYPFPVGQKWNCRLVYDAELDSLYATAGYNTNLFFARCPGTGSGSGAQAGVNGPQLPGLSASARGGVVSVRYSLSVSERTRLDIYDPVGRKVLSRDMGMQSVGEHCEQVSLSELGTQRRAAHAGILLLRLTHGPTTERAKIVLF